MVAARSTCGLVKRTPSSTSPPSPASSGAGQGPTSRFVIYSDQYVSGENGPPDVSMVKGFNVFALSFLLLSGAADQAVEWTLISASDRAKIKSQYTAAGISIVVSAFGSTDTPTSTNADPIKTANAMAAWVKEYNVDGIDVDYEDFDAFNANTGTAEEWLMSFTKQLRSQLPQGQYILSHAPVAPWFKKDTWSGGGYLAVDQAVGNLIDWYNIQFYNQGSMEYTTCDGLLTASGGSWPGTSLFEIAANGVSLSKLVIGKPAQASDASNGYIAPATLAGCLVQAKSKGWGAGVMTWEYPQANSSWIQTVRSQAFP
ncbi:glycoside hydrolase family 18 protein [Vararia minispora EC-137]|uniref:Glycoside hydrolase family 18 protein n=1 Tax=Vararia minispora EC-137 TaxID=1314806 RepID=A0ACB8QSZ5_9AGAM|nr:glycoside hydrolase family 18 protein [Vararia minispora EC-137]